MRVRGFAVVAAIAGLSLVGNVHAQGDPPPPHDSAVDQYTELVPSSRGPKAPGIGREKRGALPRKAKKALETTPRSTAEALTDVATSSNYGAPARRASQKPEPVARDAPAPGEEPSLDRTLQATAVAAAPVDDGRMVGLLVVMLAIAVGGGALAVRRRGV